MSEIFLPLKPRPLEDPAAAGVVQANLEYLMQLFQKGISDGDTLVWDATLGRFIAQPAGGVDNVVALPTTDLKPGREIILTDSLTAPTYHWHLRYNADSSSSYKWECIGGTPAVSAVAGSGTLTNNTTYNDLSDVAGPDFTLPTGVGGDFLFHVSAQARSFNNAGNYREALMAYAVGATAANDADAAETSWDDYISIFMESRKNGIASGALIRAKYRMTTADGTITFRQRRLSTIPYRVG